MRPAWRNIGLIATNVILALISSATMLYLTSTSERSSTILITGTVLLFVSTSIGTAYVLLRQLLDIKSTEEMLKTALSRERAMLLEQRLFLSMVSHEFRTPLSVLDSAATNLMAVPPIDREDLEQRSLQMRRATRSLSHLVDNCLVSERIELGGFHPIPKEVKVLSVVSAAASLVNWSPRHTSKIICDATQLSWYVDPTLMRIALSNLIDNAVKYSAGGTVTISADVTDGVLCIRVADQGPGINSETAEHLFQKYVRGTTVKHAKPVRGSGLGLYACRLIVESHGGSVTLCSGAPGNTVFEIRLQEKPDIVTSNRSVQALEDFSSTL